MTIQLADTSLSNEADRKKLLGVLKEISASMTRMDGEKDLIKESVKDICKELNLPKRLVNKLAKVYHKQNFDEEVAVHDEFETFYEKVVK
jgi:hypothetical protein